MDSKRPKQRPLEDSESYGNAENKRPRTDDGDEIREFFALVERIQAVDKLLKQKTMNCSSTEEISAEEKVDAKIRKSKSPWKPSFEWEDFSTNGISAGGNGDLTSAAKNIASTSTEIQTPGFRNGDRVRAGSSDKYPPVQSIDLNVEATAEHPVPSPLRLFQ